MPYGKEIHFGFVGPEKSFAFATRIRSEMLDNNDKSITLEKFMKVNTGKKRFTSGVSLKDVGFNPKLKIAFINTVHAFGWTTGTLVDSTLPPDQYIGVISPWGNRAASVWSLDCQYDPHENYEIPEELTLGVNLSARYFPSILDMKDEHGTMGSCIVLDKEFFDKVEICKRELIAQIPELYDGEIYIRDIFY
jgi:hypothetical protein